MGMGQREGLRGGNKEVGMRLWVIGKGVERITGKDGCSYRAKGDGLRRQQSSRNAVMEHREGGRRGCREGRMQLWGIGQRDRDGHREEGHSYGAERRY